MFLLLPRLNLAAPISDDSTIAFLQTTEGARQQIAIVSNITNQVTLELTRVLQVPIDPSVMNLMSTVFTHLHEIYNIVGVNFNFWSELNTLANVCTLGSSYAGDAGGAHNAVLIYLNNTHIDFPDSQATLEGARISDRTFVGKVTWCGTTPWGRIRRNDSGFGTPLVRRTLQ
jgi:hypothetical protein